MTVRAFFYGPPNWIVTNTTAEDRRMFGFWTFVAATALTPAIGSLTLGVYAISIVALIPNFTAETPVEPQ